MSERASFILGRALPLGVFGFLVAIQGELAYAGVQQAFAGVMDRAQVMYLLNRVLTIAFFAFLLGIYTIRRKALAHVHNPVAVAAAQVARTYFEEPMMRTVYPSYEAYARHTCRLIPFIV